mmetsp:Transcript_16252/g.31162  ORF Transcript_16252/g.31162 Transcript_16252/m.31162 type:complete len:101 (-) Transcript_16252:768-1070(-)
MVQNVHAKKGWSLYHATETLNYNLPPSFKLQIINLPPPSFSSPLSFSYAPHQTPHQYNKHMPKPNEHPSPPPLEPDNDSSHQTVSTHPYSPWPLPSPAHS